MSELNTEAGLLNVLNNSNSDSIINISRPVFKKNKFQWLYKILGGCLYCFSTWIYIIISGIVWYNQPFYLDFIGFILGLGINYLFIEIILKIKN